MGWLLVVSENDAFHREVIARAGEGQEIVGATGNVSACGLVRGIDVSAILVDGEDEVGKRFVTVLGTVPGCLLPRVVVVGPAADWPLYLTAPTVAAALVAARLPGERAA